jgi:crotonobetainyl-CoA:carnitine CoA-transferase CaiB-like acyl-CoA transferase
MASLFDGVRVLSLAEQYPGPYATLFLADEVIAEYRARR